MKTFKFSFSGCMIDAIGAPSSYTETYTANNMGEALFMLNTDYQHIKILSATQGKKKLPIPEAVQDVELIDNGYTGKHGRSK